MIELIPTVATSFATAMATNAFKGAKGPAQALDDIMSLVGFEKLHFYAEKKRAENEVFIKDYKEKIAQELVKIPEENIQEPPLAIVGPALEASRFYIEEGNLREMFAKLIASSMDETKNSYMHPSFVEVIKQLSKEDALFLKEFQKFPRLPYGKVSIMENKKEQDEPEVANTGNFRKLSRLPNFPSLEEFNKQFTLKHQPYIDYFYFSESRTSFYQNDFSISSLNRLGLINISEGISLSNSNVYDEIENEFDSIQRFLEKDEHRKEHIPDGFHLELKKGVIDLSTFGISFLSVCI